VFRRVLQSPRISPQWHREMRMEGGAGTGGSKPGEAETGFERGRILGAEERCLKRELQG